MTGRGGPDCQAERGHVALLGTGAVALLGVPALSGGKISRGVVQEVRSGPGHKDFGEGPNWVLGHAAFLLDVDRICERQGSNLSGSSVVAERFIE